VKYCDEYVCLWVCLSVCKDISGTTLAIFSKLFVHVAYVHGSVLLRHVYDRSHRLSPGKGFLPHCRERGDGGAQRGRSRLSMIALFMFTSCSVSSA